jgi:GT2 family glycosyltransferase/glycosyltransferase involved in cell wall biosynthesis
LGGHSHAARPPELEFPLSLSLPTDGTHPVLLCLYAPHLPLGSARIDAVEPMPALAGLASDTEVLLASDLASAFQSAQVASAGRPLLLLDAAVALPAYCALRLLRLGRQERLISLPQSAWLHEALGIDLGVGDASLDRACWLAGESQPVASLSFNPQACLVPASAVATLAESWSGSAPSLPSELEAALYLRGCTPGGVGSAAEGSRPLLQALAEQLRPLLAQPLDEGHPGLDGRPVLLHALHGWGGGSARFVSDLIRSRRDCHHLVLQAESDFDRRLPGCALALRLAPDAAPLRRHVLAAPIAVTALASRECDEFLQGVRNDYGVSGVLVSSLIGLSLDLLRSGLPTAVFCHDYHPLWPSLHVDFGAAELDTSEDAQKRCLEAQGPEYPFGERRAQAWRTLRAAYIDTLKIIRPTLLAPTHAVFENLLRLAPELSSLPRQVIAHGIAPWAAGVEPLQPPPPRQSLRVLVPGRINGGKGEHLLSELVRQLPENVELVLLGCGRTGMRFFGVDRVHIRLDYLHAELPSAIATLAPDLALLPASVSETFSYTLSELWSLGVPVLATRIGSYAERIEHGRNGLLVEPDAAAIARALGFIARNRAPLAALRSAPVSVQDLESMAAAHAEALPLTSGASRAPGEGDCAPIQKLVQLSERIELIRSLELTEARQRAAETEAERRAQWARERDRWARKQEELVAERTAWAQSQQARLDELGERVREQNALRERAEQRAEQAESQFESLEARLHFSEDEQERLRQHLAAVEQQRDQFEDERNEILGSLSWRLTKPLRFARRLLSRGLVALRFRRNRTSSLVGRGLRSLKTRGVRGTVERIRAEVRPQLPPTVLALPAPEPFQPFALPCPAQPRVSVIIPVYNHLDHSLTCLRSIAANPSQIEAEIIVVDDCSSDETESTLPRIDGLRYQRNPQNLGFIGACNAGAENARGEFVVFLNNDTAVQPGWLDALIDTFEQQQDVGLVGAKLVYPDGRLQEAGGIVFSDASGWNYGRFGDPAAPEYNYLREVDYCSGAAIAIRTGLFNEFGGFDSHYAPAYYEDTDLAMKVWARGLRVLYQPKSAVVHFEGISSGTDTSSGTKAYQVVNQKKFLERWGERLKSHAQPGSPIWLARQHRDTRRVLIIDATTPAPDQDSGSLRMVNLMQVLRAEGCAVTFFADNRAHVERYTEELQQLGVEVLWHPFLADPVAWFEEHGRHLDLVILSRHYIAVQYMELVRLHAPRARLVFDTVDLHYLREQREAELGDRDDLRRQAAQTRDRELDLIRRSDVTLVVSPVEQALLSREAPGARVDILSNVHEVFGRRRAYRDRHDLVFMGGYQHTPNVDAVLWFADHVLPLIREHAPEITFHVVGSKAPEAVRALAEREGVMFHGFVPDIAPFMDNCRLAVAPLRYGAGVKGKVNMSMSYGQPVVATPIAIEGMHAEPGVDVLVAEDPGGFAAAVLRAYRDEALWTQLSDNGLANVERHFSFAAAQRAVQALFED